MTDGAIVEAELRRAAMDKVGVTGVAVAGGRRRSCAERPWTELWRWVRRCGRRTTKLQAAAGDGVWMAERRL